MDLKFEVDGFFLIGAGLDLLHALVDDPVDFLLDAHQMNEMVMNGGKLRGVIF